MTEPLERARERRAGLRAAMLQVESAIAAPAAERDRQWREDVGTKLEGLAGALDAHIAETESPDGLLAEIMLSAPRLAYRVDKARADHVALRADVGGARVLVAGDADVADVRDRLVDLLMRLARHRQIGSDLVYEAYSVDIEAAD